MKRMLSLLVLMFVLGTAGACVAGPGWTHGYGSGMYGHRAGWNGYGPGYGPGHGYGHGPDDVGRRRSGL